MELPVDMIVSQGIFAVLFIWLFINTQGDSKKRESRLMEHLEKTTDTLESLSNRMETISTKVDHIDNRLSTFEDEVKLK